MSVPVEFTVSYDEASARRAARTLFMLIWGRLLPWIGVGLAMTVIVTPFLARIAGFSWLYWFLLAVLLYHALLAYLCYWRPTRRVAEALSGASVRYEFDDKEFRVSSKRGSLALPWTEFKSAAIDGENLLLYQTKRNIIVIPTNSIPRGGIDVAFAHVRRR